MKYIKSNLGFIVSMIILAAIALSPQLKGLVLQGLMRTGLFKPDIVSLEKKESSVSEQSMLKKAPSVIFQSSAGDIINISAPAGKVIFLNFWATWCPPCIAEMPSIQALKNRLKGKEVAFVMVDVDNKLNLSEAFMKKHQYNLQVYSQAGSIPSSLFNGTLPTTVIINRNGEIVFYQEGMADYNSAEMEKLFNELMK